MNKADLISSVAEKIGMSKTKTNDVLETLLGTIKEELVNGGKVTLIGFGTFQTSERKERKGRNPKDGSELLIPAKTVAKFKPGSALQKVVNGEEA